MLIREVLLRQKRDINVLHSPGTYRFYLGKSKTLNDYLGNLEHTDITKDVLMEFILALRQRNGNITHSTINKYIGVLKRALKDQCDYIVDFKKLREVQRVIQVVPKEYIGIWLNHFYSKRSNRHSFRNYIYFRLILETGLRFSEVLSLEINHIDFNTNTILVKETKGKRERYVFISTELSNTIMQYIATYEIDRLLIAKNNGLRLQHEAINAIILRAKSTLNIPKHIPLNTHTWRHTFATNYCKRGGNLETLRMILGHQDIQTTQRYIHLDSEYLRNDYMKTMKFK